MPQFNHLLLIHTPEAEHGNSHLCSHRGQGGSPREISQASGWFALTPVSIFNFCWGQRLAAAAWHAMVSTACGLCPPSSSGCAQVGSCLADTSHILRGFLKLPCFLINTHFFLSTPESLRLGFYFSWLCVRVSYWMWAFTDWGFVMEYRACHLQGWIRTQTSSNAQKSSCCLPHFIAWLFLFSLGKKASKMFNSSWCFTCPALLGESKGWMDTKTKLSL